MGPLFCSVRKRMFEQARAELRGAHPEFEPEFADDGFCGGTVDAVLASFRRERELAERYGLRFDLSKTTLYLLAGESFQGDVCAFEQMGIRIVRGRDIQMLQVPVSGTQDFYSRWNQEKMDAFEKEFEAVENLRHSHVAFHILQQCLSFSKLSYICRTTPRAIIEPLLSWYGDQIHLCFSRILGRAIMDRQWV